jgi:hypothetical protein
MPALRRRRPAERRRKQRPELVGHIRLLQRHLTGSPFIGRDCKLIAKQIWRRGAASRAEMRYRLLDSSAVFLGERRGVEVALERHAGEATTPCYVHVHG